MPLKRPIALLLPLATLLGCGAGTTPQTTPATPNLSGNWQFEIQTAGAPPISSFFDFLGALNVQGSTATGTFRVSNAQLGSPCPSSNEDIAFTGSIDANDLLTLTSAPFSGSVATLKLQLPLNSEDGIAQGTAQVVGDVCAFPSASLIGILVPPIAGTYAGTLTAITEATILVPTGTNPPIFEPSTPVPGASGPATITFTQSPADADGRFPVTASFSYTSPACTVTSTLTGFANGLGLELNNTPTPGAPSLSFSAGIPPSAIPHFNAEFLSDPVTPACSYVFYTGTFTQQ